MDHRDTMDGKGRGETTDNVVRLPRDWIGPRDELAPMGSRARMREVGDAQHDDSRGGLRAGDGATETAPAAGDFWTAGASAVHHAIQGPTPAGPAPVVGAEHGAERPREERPRDEPPPEEHPRARMPASRRAGRGMRHARPGLRVRRAWGYRARRPGVPLAAPALSIHLGRLRLSRWTAVAGAIAAACVLTMTAIGLSEGGPSPAVRVEGHVPSQGAGLDHQLRPDSGSGAISAQRTTSTSRTRHARRPVSRGRHAPNAWHHDTSSRASSHTRRTASSHGREVGTRHPAATTQSSSSQVPTTTQAITPTPTAPAPTPPTVTQASTSSGGHAPTTTHHSAYGEHGLLGAGHSSSSS